MSSQAFVLLDPVPWRPGLAGDYPGQQSIIELAPQRVPMIFCWCPPTPPGQPFPLGSPPDEPEREGNEAQVPTDFPQGFWLARYPVNQQQWQSILGTNPSRRGQGDLYPVDTVSWEDADDYCRKAGLRLPTAAEWEYACRAGTTTPFGIGAGQCLNAQMANFAGNYPYGSGREAFPWLNRERTLPQGSFPPNAWGLHDLHGQLWEWCEDELEGGERALRGGAWVDYGGDTRSAYRYGYAPGSHIDYNGFRPCTGSAEAQAKAEDREFAAPRGKEGRAV